MSANPLGNNNWCWNETTPRPPTQNQSQNNSQGQAVGQRPAGAEGAGSAYSPSYVSANHTESSGYGGNLQAEAPENIPATRPVQSRPQSMPQENYALSPQGYQQVSYSPEWVHGGFGPTYQYNPYPHNDGQLPPQAYHSQQFQHASGEVNYPSDPYGVTPPNSVNAHVQSGAICKGSYTHAGQPVQEGTPAGPETQEIRIECPDCGEILTGVHATGNLTRHRRSLKCRSSSQRQEHRCSICGKTYTRSDGLRNHERRKHDGPLSGS